MHHISLNHIKCAPLFDLLTSSTTRLPDCAYRWWPPTNSSLCSTIRLQTFKPVPSSDVISVCALSKERASRFLQVKNWSLNCGNLCRWNWWIFADDAHRSLRRLHRPSFPACWKWTAGGRLQQWRTRAITSKCDRRHLSEVLVQVLFQVLNFTDRPDCLRSRKEHNLAAIVNKSILPSAGLSILSVSTESVLTERVPRYTVPYRVRHLLQ